MAFANDSPFTKMTASWSPNSVQGYDSVRTQVSCATLVTKDLCTFISKNHLEGSHELTLAAKSWPLPPGGSTSFQYFSCLADSLPLSLDCLRLISTSHSCGCLASSSLYINPTIYQSQPSPAHHEQHDALEVLS